ncbi:hypothetical protein OBBRIDRAFT_789320 [Obba rivulosa]|uniref:Uncharacterized protein n=1 Tax=Obba rivulosa TaxID=1052685 RepID=A0A8E2DRC9_9APHY|nr:hypothetical protein OBBRIDRAFT_789320 [Obba rivulosa]
MPAVKLKGHGTMSYQQFCRRYWAAQSTPLCLLDILGVVCLPIWSPINLLCLAQREVSNRGPVSREIYRLHQQEPLARPISESQPFGHAHAALVCVATLFIFFRAIYRGDSSASLFNIRSTSRMVRHVTLSALSESHCILSSLFQSLTAHVRRSRLRWFGSCTPYSLSQSLVLTHRPPSSILRLVKNSSSMFQPVHCMWK